MEGKQLWYKIQYRTAEFNITSWAAASFGPPKLLKKIEMYILFFLSMIEQMINSLRPVGKCLRLVRSGWLRLDIRPDCTFQQGATNIMVPKEFVLIMHF